MAGVARKISSFLVGLIESGDYEDVDTGNDEMNSVWYCVLSLSKSFSSSFDFICVFTLWKFFRLQVLCNFMQLDDISIDTYTIFDVN